MRDTAEQLDRLVKLAEGARSAEAPALRAEALARLQRLSGWALRQAIDDCRAEELSWRAIAPFVQIPFQTLQRQHAAGGRIVVRDSRSERVKGEVA